MKPDDDQAWDAAVWVARKERHEKLFKEHNLDRTGKAQAERDVSKTHHLEVLAERQDADDLLSEAREYVEADAERVDALRESALGVLWDGLNDIHGYDYQTAEQMRQYYLKNFTSHFDDPATGEAWRLFLEAAADWNTSAMFRNFRLLLGLVEEDLYREPLPPVATRREDHDLPGTTRDELLFFQLEKAIAAIADDPTTLQQIALEVPDDNLHWFRVDNPQWVEFLEAASRRHFREMFEALSSVVCDALAQLGSEELPIRDPELE